MSKKLFGKIFILLLVVGLLFAVAPTKQAQAQTADTSWYTGEGPYTISTADQLAGLAQLVNGGNNFAGKTISLSNNIDLAAYTNWTPIGGTLAFNGVFDGGGHTISNLTVNRPNEDAVGLFGYISGTIQNFTLSGVTITGRNMVGGASGRLFPDGTVNNVTVTGVLINAKHWAGGIAGHVFGQLNNVHANDVVVTLTFDTVANDNGDKGGGLVGYMDETTISNCSATDVTISGTRDVGGLVGAAGGSTITNCTSTGATVTSTNIDGNTLAPYTGGAVGRASGALTVTNVIVTNATLTSTPAGYTGLIVGGGVGPVTLNNVKLVHDTTETFYSTIQAAVTASVDGDTITAAPGTYAVTSQITINKAITLQGLPGAKIQVSGSGYRFLFTAGATLDGFEIEKIDKTGEQNIIGIQASNVTISDNVFHGQYVMGDPEVARAMEISGGYDNLSITGNTIYSLRQPAYVNGPVTGVVVDNDVYNTRGWVLAGGYLVFTDNSWGDGTQPNAVDIAIVVDNPPFVGEWYTDIAAMSAANNDAVIEDQRTTPRVLSVVYVDDSAAPGGDGTQLKPYQTIQEGVVRVVAGGTIHVAAGNYTFSAPIEIAKNMTIEGADKATTFIKPSATLTYFFRVPSGSSLSLSNFTFDGAGFDVYGGVRIADGASGTISNNIFTNIVNPGYTGFGIVDYGDNAVISNNTFSNIGRVGMWIGGTGVQVTGNTYTGKGEGDWLDYGIEIGMGGTATITGNTISNCYGVASTDSSVSAAVLVTSYYDPGTSATLTNNTFSDSSYGIAGGYNDTDNSTMTATGNTFTNIPVSVTLTNSSIMDLVSTLAANTFPDGSIIIGNDIMIAPPVHNVTQDTYFNTIQAAIADANANDVINVAAGTYYGPLTIDKQLSLIGPNSAINPNTGSRVAEAVILYPTGLTAGADLVTVNADGVTIDGFTLDGKDLGGTLWGEGIYGEVNNLTVKNNIIKNFMQIGIRIYSNIAGPYYSGALIENNQIISDVAGRYFTYSGIYLQGTHGEVRGNVVDDAYRGIQIQPYNHPSSELGIVENNTFSAYKSPIYFNYSSAANGNWVFRRNIATGIASPEGSPVDYFGGITVQTFGGGNVLFDKNQVTLGATDATSKYLYYEIGTVSGTSSATPNWWGSVTGPAEGSYSGDAEYLPYCTNLECTEFSQAKLSMSPATIEALTCGPQTLDVLVTDVVDLTAYHLEIDFDETKVRIDSVVNGGFLHDTANSTVIIDAYGNDLGNDTGKLIFGAYLQANEGFGGDPAPVTGTGTLITITFTPLLGSTNFAVDAINSLLVSWPDAFAMPFSATGATATLTGGLVKNVDTSVNYCSLASAVEDANSGEGLQLLDSFTIPATVTIDKDLTLDLNGEVVTFSTTVSNAYALTVDGTGAALTVKDTATAGTGKILVLDADADGSTDGRGIGVINGSLTLDGGTIQAPYAGVYVRPGTSMVMNSGTIGGDVDQLFGIAILGPSTLEINGGTIESTYFAVSGNGTPGYGETTIQIDGGTLTSAESVAIYHPQVGNLTITDGTITGTEGIEINSGGLSTTPNGLIITGGEIYATGDYVASPLKEGGSSTDSGDAILIYSIDGGYTGTMNVTISGGIIHSANNYALRELVYLDDTSRLGLVTITGGEFDGGAGAVYFTTTGASHLALTDGRYNTDPGITGGADYVYTPYDTYVGTYESDDWFMIDPVDITATTLAGPYTAGVPATVTITVADTDHTGPFEVVFDYPAGTSITFGGTTVVCDSSGCPVIEVTLTYPGPTNLSFEVTLPGAGTYDVGVELYHNAGAGDIRLLDYDTATGVVVSGDFTVAGTFSMQGRTVRGGIPVTLTWGGTLETYGPSADTTEAIENNFSLIVNYGGTYTITTLQPRYLNVVTLSAKTITVDGNEVLPALRLRGGNAVWIDDNKIDGGDASLVGTQYGDEVVGEQPLDINHGDCNFDGIVNIQDLALVGGNFDLQSDDPGTPATFAYTAWLQ